MNFIQDEEAALELAALVLDMGMVTDKGLVARKLARRVFGMTDAGADLVPIVTNGTLRMIPRGEPVFLLRAQDIHAAPAVRCWARMVAGDQGLESEIVKTAIAHAGEMDRWPVKKSPNLPAKG